MKITMNIDCTPEEARAFFGLPDVRALQEAMLKTDPAAFVQASTAGMEQMQKLFWAQMQQAMGGKNA